MKLSVTMSMSQNSMSRSVRRRAGYQCPTLGQEQLRTAPVTGPRRPPEGARAR